MKRQLKNFKNLILCFFVLGFSLTAFAQNSTVSFTIQDPSSQVFANGTLTYVIVPTGQYIFNGSPLSNIYYSPQTISLDGTGSGTLTLPRNDFITPINSQWQFTVCPNASSPCTTVNVIINQANQNISSVINAQVPLIKIPISSVPRAYSDSEVITTVAAGGIYYNVTLGALRLWNGSAWSTIGSGGGGSVSITSSTTDLTISPTPCTGTCTIDLNLTHANTWIGPQTYSNGAGTPDSVKVYNDPTDGEGVYFESGAGSPLVGGLLNNSVGGSILWTSNGPLDFCNLIDCSTGDVTLDLAGTGTESPFPSMRFFDSGLNQPFVLTDSQGIWLGAQFSFLESNPSFLQPGVSQATNNTMSISTIAPVIHFTGTAAISTITLNYPTATSYTNTDALYIIADAAWTTTTSGNINTAMTAVAGQVYLFIYDGSKWSILAPGSGGGGLPCSGTCTANAIPKFGSGGTTVGNSTISDNGTTVTVTEPVTITPSGGVGGGYAYTEGTVSAGVSGVDNLQAVSAIHRLEMNPNNTGATEVVGSSTSAATSGNIATYATNGYDIQDSGVALIANSTTTPPTTAVGAASGGIDTCSASATTITMPGLTTSMTVTFTPTSDTSSASGWDAGLYIRPWVSAANTVSYKVCNPTSGSLTPASITLNVSAR